MAKWTLSRWGWVGLSLGLAGCNLLGWMDTPSGDDQLLSRARACWEKGDLPCALEYYGKLSSDYRNIRHSETALAMIDQEGLSFSDFLAAFGQSSGKAFTVLANKLIGSAGQSKRTAMYAAYLKVLEITGSSVADTETRGLVRLFAATAVAAEILAELHLQDGTRGLSQTDLVQDPAGCLAVPLSCAAPIGAIIANVAGDYGASDMVTDPAGVQSDMTGASLDTRHLDAALNALAYAANTELQSIGFMSGFGAAATAIKDNDSTLPTFYYGLISQGVGL